MASVTRTPTACNRVATVLRRGRVVHRLFVAAVALLRWLLSAPRLHAQTRYGWCEPGERRHLVSACSRLAQPYIERMPGLEAAMTSARDAPTAADTARDGLALSTLPRRG